MAPSTLNNDRVPYPADLSTKETRKIALSIIATSFIIVTAFALVNVTPANAALGDVLASCAPTPSGNGRALAFDGTNIYYTLGSSTIYKIDTSCGVISSCTSSEAAVGALAFDSADGNAWAGDYSGGGQIWKLNPSTCTTVVAPFVANHGGITTGDSFPGIDGLTLDTSDGTLWWSSDEATHIHHISVANAIIGTCDTPPPIGAATGKGLNSGIAYNHVQDNLVLSLFTSVNGEPKSITVVNKADSGVCTKVAGEEFSTDPVLGPNGVEDLELDTVTFPGKVAVWSNEFASSNQIRAWEIKSFAGVPEFSVGAPLIVSIMTTAMIGLRTLVGRKRAISGHDSAV